MVARSNSGHCRRTPQRRQGRKGRDQGARLCQCRQELWRSIQGRLHGCRWWHGKEERARAGSQGAVVCGRSADDEQQGVRPAGFFVASHEEGIRRSSRPSRAQRHPENRKAHPHQEAPRMDSLGVQGDGKAQPHPIEDVRHGPAIVRKRSPVCAHRCRKDERRLLDDDEHPRTVQEGARSRRCQSAQRAVRRRFLQDCVHRPDEGPRARGRQEFLRAIARLRNRGPRAVRRFQLDSSADRRDSAFGDNTRKVGHRHSTRRRQSLHPAGQARDY
mmetsp:Transcript_5726/g.16983  ORF Transcript_5726/g.16983 Transcript_5726/m.16983 type:complete len:273 (+) Transcript_5726:1431-2249(+)